MYVLRYTGIAGKPIGHEPDDPSSSVGLSESFWAGERAIEEGQGFRCGINNLN